MIVTPHDWQDGDYLRMTGTPAVEGKRFPLYPDGGTKAWGLFNGEPLVGTQRAKPTERNIRRLVSAPLKRLGWWDIETNGDWMRLHHVRYNGDPPASEVGFSSVQHHHETSFAWRRVYTSSAKPDGEAHIGQVFDEPVEVATQCCRFIRCRFRRGLFVTRQNADAGAADGLIIDDCEFDGPSRLNQRGANAYSPAAITIGGSRFLIRNTTIRNHYRGLVAHRKLHNSYIEGLTVDGIGTHESGGEAVLLECDAWAVTLAGVHIRDASCGVFLNRSAEDVVLDHVHGTNVLGGVVIIQPSSSIDNVTVRNLTAINSTALRTGCSDGDGGVMGRVYVRGGMLVNSGISLRDSYSPTDAKRLTWDHRPIFHDAWSIVGRPSHAYQSDRYSVAELPGLRSDSVAPVYIGCGLLDGGY